MRSFLCAPSNFFTSPSLSFPEHFTLEIMLVWLQSIRAQVSSLHESLPLYIHLNPSHFYSPPRPSYRLLQVAQKRNVVCKKQELVICMDQHGQSLHDGSGDGFALGDVGGCVPEVDGALLMELLEDTPSDQPPEDVDRLSLVIRSLEAELGCGSASAAVGVDGAESMTAGTPSDDGYGGLEDVLSELDGTGRCAAAEAAAMEYYWPEAPVVVASHDMGGWYVDGEGYEMRDQFVQYYYADGSVEQVYSPLWE